MINFLYFMNVAWSWTIWGLYVGSYAFSQFFNWLTITIPFKTSIEPPTLRTCPDHLFLSSFWALPLFHLLLAQKGRVNYSGKNRCLKPERWMSERVCSRILQRYIHTKKSEWNHPNSGNSPTESLVFFHRLTLMWEFMRFL